MRVANLNQAIWEENQKKKQMGHFGYGDYGSAAADHIIDEAQASWTDNQLQEAKAEWRALVLNLNEAIKSRNAVIATIKSMPDGSDKQLAVGAFHDADSNFMYAYEIAQPLFSQFASLTGDVLPQASEANFGALPLAAWAVVALSLAAVSAAAAAMYNSKLRYDALLQNPQIAQYDRGGDFFSSIGDQLGTGLKWGLVALAGVAAVMMLRKNV